MSETSSFMIYGANGYTGRYCALEAVRRGLRPIIAGRDTERVAHVAAELNLPQRVFALEDTVSATRALEGVRVVLNCAGPFSRTAKPLLDACVVSKSHYLDVTGEIVVFEYIHQLNAIWREAGIVVLPGAGFDVVPTDCMAAMLKEALPDATRLRLAFKNKRGRLSPGTAKTMIEGFAQGCTVRRNGTLEQTSFGALSDTLPYPGGPSLSVVIPWGDVSTAYYSTGIPNIEVYTAIPPGQLDQIKSSGAIFKLLRLKWAQIIAQKIAGWAITGPDDEQREMDSSELYGDAANEEGYHVSMTMTAPNGYSLTFESSITCAERVLAGEVAPGAWTPSLAFGSHFITELSGVSCSLKE